jgi:curved DNA-binding protein CbpA
VRSRSRARERRNLQGMAGDPYKTLGVSRTASDKEIRAAYRRLVQLHHPDHNDGSPQSARRFEEVQEAYAKIRELRAAGASGAPPPRARTTRQRPTPPPRSGPIDPDLEARIADLERQLNEARKARERARRAAQEAASSARRERPTDEDLGYYSTDDSFTKILSDARSQLSDKFSEARDHPVVRRVSELIDGLEQLASKLDRHDHQD